MNISPARLAELEKKERAHDDYLAATKAIRSRSAAVELEARGLRPGQGIIPSICVPRDYAAGYRDAHRDISAAILEAGRLYEMDRAAVSDAPRSRHDAPMEWGRR